MTRWRPRRLGDATGSLTVGRKRKQVTATYPHAVVELTDTEIGQTYGGLIEQALVAFTEDGRYLVDMMERLREYEVRWGRRDSPQGGLGQHQEPGP